mmetsp:Transcript_32220/g.78584  ORF Transcript_32220/g.78584 Transcript_32220/m.78584 type:complete len:277 (-) Transcript_32220:841-1671(-)
MSNSNNKTSWLNYKKKEMNPHFCSRSMVTPLLRWKAAVTSASASAGVSAGGVGGFVGGIRHIAILPSSQQLPRQLQQQLCDNNGTATATATTTTIRSKHSSTQIKRLFKKNPAKRRVALKKNMNETTTSSSSTVVDGNSSAGGGVIPEPQFAPVVESPKFLPNGWCPLPSDDASAGSSSSSKYPFRVSRTGNKPQDSVGFLPVYSEYRKDGARVTTRIKKVSGDTDIFLSELRAALQIPIPRNPRDDVVHVRSGGAIEVKGNRVREVKHWLAGLGF